MIVWFLATVTCVLLCVVHWIGVFNYQAMLTGIVSPVLNTFLLLFTVAVYVYIFCEYRRKRNQHQQIQQRRRLPDIKITDTSTMSRRSEKFRISNRATKLNLRRESVYDTFRHSRFYLDFLMVCSFVVLLVVPNLLYICHGWEVRERTHQAKDANKLCYQVLFVINFVLCVWMNTDVRLFCRKTVRKKKSRAEIDLML